MLKYVLFLAAPFLCAQSLHIPPSAASQQLSGSFLVILTSPAGRSPLALQWKMLVPGDVLINLKDVAPGNRRLVEMPDERLLLERQLAKPVRIHLHDRRVVHPLEQRPQGWQQLGRYGDRRGSIRCAALAAGERAP